MGKQVVVVGGSVAGLGVGLALSSLGHRVTILERDATPLPPSPIEAFETWDRRGSPQTRHSHAFLARLHNLILDRAPDLYASLREHGAEPLRFTDMARQHFPDSELLPEDEEITLLACRRITFEWVLRRHVLDSGRVKFLDGVDVQGLEAESGSGGPPLVTGVRVRRGDEHTSLSADLVVDASGRRSRLPHWLEAIGGRPLREDSEPCGIFYSSRFYRLLDGVEPPVMEGAIGADLGYMKYAVFPGDSRIFSVTLAASPDDDTLRSVLRVRAFEAAAREFPAVRPWIDPAVSEPITEVHGMGMLQNSRRHFVDDGEPLALGLFPIGDALIHTNPITGRGCTLAWLGAFLLADALDREPDDLRAFALALHEDIEREITPWYDAALMQDRDAIEVEALQRQGVDPFATQREDGTANPRAFMRSVIREGLVPGLREDLVLLRAFMRVFNLLESPTNLMRDPVLMQRILAAYRRREEREPQVLGPSRSEMMELLARAA